MERAFCAWGLLFCCLEEASRSKYRTFQRGEGKQITGPMAGMMQREPCQWPRLSLPPAVSLNTGWSMIADPATVSLQGWIISGELKNTYVFWKITLMFHVFIIQNCFGSLSGLVNSLRMFSSTMCRNCGSQLESFHISMPTMGCCLPPWPQHCETALTNVHTGYKRNWEDKEKGKNHWH